MENNNLIYGCMGLGGEWNRSPVQKKDIKIAEEAILTCLDCGINTFDHADIYTIGKSEVVFGEFLKNNPSYRDRIKIQSKAGIILDSGPKGSNTYNFSKEYVLEQITKILKRLNTDYLDTFLIHRPDPLTSFAELGKTLNIVKERGYTKNIAVSNMSTHQIKALQQYIDTPLVANQLQFSLGHSQLIDNGVLFNSHRSEDHSVADMVEYSQLNNMEIQAWGALDQGLYTNNDAATDSSTVMDTRKLLSEIAETYNTNTSAIQLAWTMKLPFAVRPIIGTSIPERIRWSSEADKIHLTRKEWYDLWITARGNVLL